MDAQTRALLIGHDVRLAIPENSNFNGNFAQKFDADLNMNLGAFSAFLNDVRKRINADPGLSLIRPFNWTNLKPDPTTGLSFAEYFLTRSVSDLIRAIDAMLAHSPYA